MSYAVSRRAKEMLDEGIYYFPKEERNKNEILEAIREINEGVITIEVNKTEAPTIKEEEDTLALLYSTIKKQKIEEKEELNDGLEELLDIEEGEVKTVDPEDKPISLWEEVEEVEATEEEVEIDPDELLVDDVDAEPIEEVVTEEKQ